MLQDWRAPSPTRLRSLREAQNIRKRWIRVDMWLTQYVNVIIVLIGMCIWISNLTKWILVLVLIDKGYWWSIYVLRLPHETSWLRLRVLVHLRLLLLIKWVVVVHFYLSFFSVSKYIFYFKLNWDNSINKDN